MKKRIIKWAAVLFFGILIYEISGALLPFIRVREVGETFQNDFDPAVFYGGEEEGPDRAAVVETSMEALDCRIEMIHQARERIILSTFDIREGQSCRDIFSSLLEAADRGVSVSVLVDGLYGSLHMNGEPVFYALAAHPNIEFKFYNIPSLLKPWTINGRMHDKYVIVDDKLLLMGGRNTFDYFLGEYNMEDLSYDRDVLIWNTGAGQTSRYDSSVISQVEDYFNAMWNSRECETVFDNPSRKMRSRLSAAEAELREHYRALAAGRPALVLPDLDYTDRTVGIKKATLIYNPTHIYGKEPWVWYQAQYLMAHAENRAYIHTPYAVLSRDMYQGMADIAAQVPSAVMMLNATSVGDNFMASSDYTLNRGKILDTGVTVYEYFGDRSSHGKSMLIDSRLSLVGSYNLDMRSTYVDTETMLVIDGEEFNRQLETCILNLEQQALRVNPDGTYDTDSHQVSAIEVPPFKNAIFAVTSRLFQLFRYLI